MCQELAERCIVVLLTFRLPYIMQHSECCKVRSKSVVSFTIQCTFFSGLLSAAGQCNSSRLRDVALVAHVVDQILLHMLVAEQTCRGIEEKKPHW